MNLRLLKPLARLVRIMFATILITIAMFIASFSPATAVAPLIHTPFFPGTIPFDQTAIFWFGAVTPSQNYADVRVGYNPDHLYINLGIFDQFLYYDPTAKPENVTQYDAIRLYLELPDGRRYRFTGQLKWWENDALYRQAEIYQNGSWQLTPHPFTTKTGWRGNAPNDNQPDRGWVITYQIPFTGFNLTAPSLGTKWRLGLEMFDKDTATYIQTDWPTGFNANQSSTWGTLHFGLAQFTPPQIQNPQTATIRHTPSTPVIDAAVGGHTNCGSGMDFFGQWGSRNYAGYNSMNIQNQSDIADWPCFSKFYVTFPLTMVPSDKRLVSAKVILHQFGNSGGGDWGQAYPSYIWASAVHQAWQESTLTWNNAPQVSISGLVTKVDPMSVPLVWPGVPHQWDVTALADLAHRQQQPLNLVFYSADDLYHSGKYFSTTDVDNWNERARPTLILEWGTATQSGDFNQDGKINLFDYRLLTKSLNTRSCGLSVDLDKSCFIDYLDLLLFLPLLHR
jgi:hypothetical protein